MHRMFRAASQLRSASPIFSTPTLRSLVTPLSQPARFFRPLPIPCIIACELHAIIAANHSNRESLKLKHWHDQRQGYTARENKVYLTEREQLAVHLVLERIRYKFGIRWLAADDAWETIAVVTHPGEWINNEVTEKGKSLEDALITAMKHMVPKAHCSNMEDVAKLISMTLPAASEINKMPKAAVEDVSAETDNSIKPK